MRRAFVLALAAASGCAEPMTGGDVPPDLLVPHIVYPHELTVTEGSSTTFVVGLDRGEDYARGMTYLDTTSITITPPRLTLSPTVPSQMFTLTALADDNTLDEMSSIPFRIQGTTTEASPTVKVRAVDIDAPNYVASNWNVRVPANGSATFDVTLSQPPSAPITVAPTLSPDDAMHVAVSPASLSFDASNYTTPQTVTATRTDTTFFAPVGIALEGAGEYPAATVTVGAPYEESGYP
jgi:hypothetical protein